VYRWRDLAKKGKEEKIPLKKDDKALIEKLSNNLQNAIKRKDSAKSNDDKLKAAADVEEARAAIKAVRPTSTSNLTIPFCFRVCISATNLKRRVK
jgi:hypothetical protein